MMWCSTCGHETLQAGACPCGSLAQPTAIKPGIAYTTSASGPEQLYVHVECPECGKLRDQLAAANVKAEKLASLVVKAVGERRDADQYLAHAKVLESERDDWKARYEGRALTAKDEWRRAENQRTRANNAEAREAAMRKALDPFARLADECDQRPARREPTHVPVDMLVADLYAARAALATPNNADERWKAMSTLIGALQNLRRLFYPHQGASRCECTQCRLLDAVWTALAALEALDG